MNEKELEQEELNAAEEVVAEEKAPKKKSANKKLTEEIEAAKAEAEDHKRKWYAVTAEYENYRRRTQNQSAQRYQEARDEWIYLEFI